ncbi:hypothetical protein H6F76_14125 [Leptolyngbya sp. FACHB-321]|uniref:hypothetical protein n=1 Tax=Leptolyngbya sp. FACHB-321 TaxID=2692807 RepID=UPI0016868998|nr:hypothetical protein [Leptolyngbya sp. FACHB-321]MBD2036156.1 hypothetical protein [Leptolyngbya sp. FACHB-321]
MAIAQLASQLSTETAGNYHDTNSGIYSTVLPLPSLKKQSNLASSLKIQHVTPITTPEYFTPAKSLDAVGDLSSLLARKFAGDAKGTEIEPLIASVSL